MADDTPEHLTGTEARAGSKTGVNRVALFGGLGLVIVIFAIILFVAGKSPRRQAAQAIRRNRDAKGSQPKGSDGRIGVG